ncbi:hypothetical protein [Allosphingosinicella sp.]|uniref:hypothetical protein n=1 Tax=Allosphingosinicella sp. TaxID=2823234 RepID=UPI003784F17B
MAKFTQNAVWADTLRLTRTHWAALIAIAGVFNFLPTLLVNHFYPMPDPPADADVQTYVQLILDYYRQNALPVVLQSFVVMIGSAAMLRLAFARGGTVGGALLYAIVLLPAFSILILLTNLAVGFGFMLLIVPGLYLWGRLLPAAPAMVAEEWRNPIEALKRGWGLSAGHAWSIVGLYLLVAIAAGILMLAISLVTGIAFKAAAGQELGTLLGMIVLCAMQAVAAALFNMLTAAIYRALAPPRPDA